MWKIFALIAGLSILAATATGQINRDIGGFAEHLNLVHSSLDHNDRPFVGTFEFENLPEPLKPVRVNFTLTVCRDYKYLKANPWPIRVDWLKKGVQLIGDTLFLWPGPHDIGDEYSGSIEVVPLSSGLFGFSFYLDSPGLITGGLAVQWCFDHDGVLSYLGKVEPGAIVPCTYDWCTFFDRDSVHVVQDIYEDELSDELFFVEYTIIPPFRIGDTSLVRYALTAMTAVRNVLDVEINTSGMTLISDPPRLKAGIAQGEVIIYDLLVVPQAVQGVHNLTLCLRNVNREADEHRCNTIVCHSVYSDDGSLRFISDRDLSAVDQGLLPKGFREMEEGDNELITLEVGAKSAIRHKY
jgi:hypothetical protein